MFATSVDWWDSLAATGFCAIYLLYAARRALKTSVVSSFRVQLCEFDTRYILRAVSVGIHFTLHNANVDTNVMIGHPSRSISNKKCV